MKKDTAVKLYAGSDVWYGHTDVRNCNRTVYIKQQRNNNECTHRARVTDAHIIAKRTVQARAKMIL